MKRVYWLLLAAVPLVLWYFNQGKPVAEPAKKTEAKAEPETSPQTEATKTEPQLGGQDISPPVNGAWQRTSQAQSPAPAASVAEEEKAGTETVIATETTVAEATAEQVAPPLETDVASVIQDSAATQAEPATVEATVEATEEVVTTIASENRSDEGGEQIELFDAQDKSFRGNLQAISLVEALVISSHKLSEREKVRLVLTFEGGAITINGQLMQQQGNTYKFKIMTMKTGQKKRFEAYLAQRSTTA